MSEQVEQLQAEVLRLSELLWGMRCIYCGEVVGKDKQNQDVAEEVLKAHIQQCDKHPVQALRTENQRLRVLIQEVVNAGCAFEDVRIPYKEVQIDRTWFDEAIAALQPERGEG